MAAQQRYAIHLVVLLSVVAPSAGEQATDFEAFMKQGFEARREGRLEEAVTAFREAANLKPNLSGVHYALARVLFEQGGLIDALAAVERAVELDPDKGPYHFLQAAIFDNLGNMGEAIKGYETATRLDPTLGQAYLSLGVSYLRGEQFEESAQALRSYLELNPGDTQALYYLAGALGEQGETEAALNVLDRLLGAEPDHAGAWLTKSRLEAQQPDTMDRALESYRKTMVLDRGNARAHYEYGVLLEKRGQTEEAIAAYRTASELSPELSEASFALGRLLSQEGQTDEAKTHLERFKSLSSGETRRREEEKRATAAFGKGQALLEEGRWPEAAAAFREVIESSPGSHPALAGLAKAQRSMADVDAAVATIRRAIELAPGVGEYAYLLSMFLHQKGDLASALTAAERAATLAPRNGLAYNALGIIRGDSGDIKGAVAGFEKAEELDPENPDYSLNLAVAYDRVGDAKEGAEAMARYREKLAASPREP